MKSLLFFSLFSLSLLSYAEPPPKLVRRVCASGKLQSGVQVSSVPFEDVTEDNDYAGKYKANYSLFNGVKIGYAKNGAAAFILYDHGLYPVSKATLLYISKSEYESMIGKGDLELGQVSDWSLLTLKNKEQYLCVALNKSMEKAIPLIYLLSLSTKPHRLYFQSGL